MNNNHKGSLTMNKESVKKVNDLLNKIEIESGKNSLSLVANFLGYNLFKNPVDPNSEWHLLSHPQLDDETQSLMALKYDEELTEETTVKELRKRYEKVEEQKDKFRGYDVYLYAFVGKGRILIFKGYDSNRDERLDISKDSIEKVSLFADNFLKLRNERIQIEEDEFGFGNMVVGLDNLFKRELTNLFILTVHLYRKQIAELIISNKNLEKHILQLLPEYENAKLKNQSLKHKLLNLNFKQAIGSVVDTIVLRVILRRFLESYHGLEMFSAQDKFTDLGLGQREGKMQDVINRLVEIKKKNITEDQVKLAINESSGQAAFDLFDDATQDIKFKKIDVSVEEVHDRLRKQFEFAYGGDLFSGDISEVVNKVEHQIYKVNPKLLLNLMVDTSEDRFNFRYEDLPPSMIQEFYESSMGHSLHYKINEEGEPEVSYSDDNREKKHRGAYYTQTELVDYMVERAIGSKLNRYFKELKSSVKQEDEKGIMKALDNISSLTVIDITSGGGSFLRGAFQYLAAKRENILRMLEPLKGTEVLDRIIECYPYFDNNNEAEAAWERHVLLRMVYGKDIDYKALIISSQTLTLSALNNWQIGVNFPNLIGLTLIQQNALISPVRVSERKEAFEPYKKEIARMIQLKHEIIQTKDTTKSYELSEELNGIRLTIQAELYERIEPIIKEEYREALMPQATEINFPEVFFEADGELKEDGGFAVSLGNPPWEIWKANAEEFFEIYHSDFRDVNRNEKERIKEDIFKSNPVIKEKWEWHRGYYEAASQYYLNNNFYNHQKAKVDGKFTAGDINLYKIATERNYQLLSNDGICGYLVPSGIYTDRGSTGLRRLLFNQTKLMEIASFENRKGIFSNVHRSYKFAVVLFEKGSTSSEFRAFFYKLNLESLQNSNEFLDIPIELVKELSPETYSVMEFREQLEVELMKKLVNFPKLSEEINNSWNLRFMTDFHLTNDNHLFNYEEKGFPLFIGRTINQYTINGDFDKYIEEEKALGKYFQWENSRISRLLKGYNDGKSHSPVEYYRFGCRAVASSTNKRSLISTVIPKNVACGNSLLVSEPYTLEIKSEHITRVPNYTTKELVVIVALMNSFVVDFVLRRKISANVNMFYLYQLPVPRLTEDEMYFEELMKRSAALIAVDSYYDELKSEVGIKVGEIGKEVRQLLQNQIDAYVAKIYGLNRDEFLYVLSTFKSPKHAEEMKQIAQGVIEQFDILEEKGELEWPT